jgi:hypothetical protein
MLMAHLSCAYLCTDKGIGSIPNEINEEANPAHMGKVRAESKKDLSGDHDSILLFWLLNTQAARGKKPMELNNRNCKYHRVIPRSYSSCR